MLATMSQHWKCRQCNTAWVEGRWTRSRRGLWYCNTCWPRESTPTIKSGDRTVGFGAYANFTYNEVLRVDPDWCGKIVQYALVEPQADPKALPLALFVMHWSLHDVFALAD